jgi:hypothetical protein
MPLVAQIICDGCLTVKNDTHHWFQVDLQNNSLCIRPLELSQDWVANSLPNSSVQYFCGRFCALESLTRWIDRLSRQDSAGTRNDVTNEKRISTAAEISKKKAVRHGRKNQVGGSAEHRHSGKGEEHQQADEDREDGTGVHHATKNYSPDRWG